MAQTQNQEYDQEYGMKLETIHVYIEYRMKSEPGRRPADKVLRARVRQESSDGFVYGAELIAPRRIVEPYQAKQICCQKLVPLAKNIVFEFDPLIGLPAEIWRSGSVPDTVSVSVWGRMRVG